MKIRPSETFWNELLVNNNKRSYEEYNPKFLLVFIGFGLITLFLIGLLVIYIWTGNSNNIKTQHTIEQK